MDSFLVSEDRVMRCWCCVWNCCLRYIQSTCATSGEGLYEGLDWLSSNIANKVIFLVWTQLFSASIFGFWSRCAMCGHDACVCLYSCRLFEEVLCYTCVCWPVNSLIFLLLNLFISLYCARVEIPKAFRGSMLNGACHLPTKRSYAFAKCGPSLST